MDTNINSSPMDAAFFDEYTSNAAILKYTRETAGYGVSYLLDHDYREVYRRALELLPPESRQRGIRVLEFGCGGGMNLIHLVSVLRREGINLDRAIGTDFSPVLIDAAQREANKYLQDSDRDKIEFLVARNETLVKDLSAAIERAPAGSFHFILGVNTIRYCHRARVQMDCARDIKKLLVPGGVCVAIDMNDRFPAFRSTLRHRFRRVSEEERYIPSLAEYAAPFEESGFEMLRKEHFCWIPHSGGKWLCGIMRGLSSVLNILAPSRAMRSLVVARKPACAAS